MPISHIVLLLICAVSILLMLVRPRGIAEVYWVGSGAVLLLLLRLISPGLAGRAVLKGADVYFFLIGMMLLSALAQQNGVFDWMAALTVHKARNSCARLFLLIYATGTIVTVCMSNDATAVVLTPAILVAVRRARVKPLGFLFACAMIANAASFVLPISNPANLVIFRDGMPSLGRWLLEFLLPSIASIAVTFAVLRWFFRGDLRGKIESNSEPVPLSADGKMVIAGLVLVTGVLLSASALDLHLGLPTMVAAFAITAAVSLKRRSSPIPLVKEISWPTLGLVAALFVLVDAVQSIAALRMTEAALAWCGHLPEWAAAYVLGFGLGITNNLVNNLPLGLLAGATLNAAHTKGLLASASAIGVDLGPNLSVTGSLATILWLLALRKEKLNVSAMDFLKVGALAMPAAMLASLSVLIAERLLLGVQ